MLPELKLALSSLSAPSSSRFLRRDLSLRNFSLFVKPFMRARAVVGLGVREKFSNKRPRLLLLRPSEPPIGVGSDIDWVILWAYAWCGVGACIVIEAGGGWDVMIGGLYAYEEEFTDGA